MSETLTDKAQEWRNGAEQGIRELLLLRGQDPDRDGLKQTPARFVKAMLEMTEGYEEDPGEILSRVFEQEEGLAYDQIIALSGTNFTSLCEHHLLPFRGEAHIAYLPQKGGNIVGLSKLARVALCFAKRFQVQERMTEQIANAIWEHLEPQGVLVVIEAHHSCMSCRGVQQSNAVMRTAALRGLFHTDISARSEAYRLIGK